MNQLDSFDFQEKLPNEQLSLIGSIVAIALSLFSCCCGLFSGIPAFITGIIALILASNDTKAYNLNPTLYAEKSFHNVKLAKTLSIIAIVLSVFSVLFFVLVQLGSFAMPEILQELQNRFPKK